MKPNRIFTGEIKETLGFALAKPNLPFNTVDKGCGTPYPEVEKSLRVK